MRDDPRQIAFSPRAPEPERVDALDELQRAHLPTRSDLLPSAEILEFAEFVKRRSDEAALSKSAKVITDPWRKVRASGQQSAWIDPWVTGRGEYYDPPSLLTYDAMRTMVRRTPVLAAAILTRVRQIRRFCTAQADSGPGFHIRHRDRSHKPDKTELHSIQLLQQYLENCGWEWNPLRRDAARRVPFGDFVAMLAEDSLVLDSAPIEIEQRRDRRGIAGFYAVDGATMRLCTEEGYDGDDAYFAVQVIAGSVRTAYTREDLILRPRNPSTSVYRAGYGQSEVDLMIQVVTGLLNAMDYNIAGFTRNEIPPGVLHISGNFDQADADSFKAYWRNMVQGSSNRWKMPVLFSKDQESRAAFERFGVEWNEMAFSKWMSFLVSILCALLGMSPEEINTEGFTGNATSSLSGSDTAEKLAMSREKGLRPNLSYFEQLISSYLIQPLSDQYIFEWTGLEEEDPSQMLELNKLAWTWNELREAQGLKPDTTPLGDAPLNPSLIGPWLQMQQQQEQAEQEDYGQMPGDGDAPAPNGEQPGEAQGNDEPPTSAPPSNDPGVTPGGQDFGKALRIYAFA